MKVQLVVVRGKPEGKVIPLAGPSFKIGRGETCHLRPNSEQVSREHAEFLLSGGTVSVRDLGSRNGTLVNGKALTTESCTLKDRDLVQVGPLTFAVSILDAPAAAPAPTAPAARPAASTPTSPPPHKHASPDDISTDDIDSWLVGESAAGTKDQPTAVYGGDTITIAAFKDGATTPPTPAPARPPSAAGDEGYERQPEEASMEQEEEEEQEEQFDSADDDEEESEEEGEEAPVEEFMDESNPFYAAKKAQQQANKAGTGPGGTHKQTFKDTSDAASEILRKLMERRRSSKS